MATFIHVSPKRNDRSILSKGLLASRATGKIKAVWVVSESEQWWAIFHVARKHKLPGDELSVFYVDLPRSALRRGKVKGTFWYLGNVPPERLAGPRRPALIGGLK